MSEPEQIQIIVKKVCITYEKYTLDEEELRQYLKDNYPNEPRIQTIRSKLWKWLKGYSDKKKPLFIYQHESDYKEPVDDPIEDSYFHHYPPLIANKVASLLNPRRTLRR
jgi:hypothetical protein